jgi:hypothetical protein
VLNHFLFQSIYNIICVVVLGSIYFLKFKLIVSFAVYAALITGYILEVLQSNLDIRKPLDKDTCL